ncbi:MAG: arylsulfotransferase family protein [Haloferacaceae archaeon]
MSELGANSELREQSKLSMDQRTPIADARRGTTVITTQSNEASGAEGALIALGPDGRLRAYDRRYDVYWDVDPVSGAESTVMYVAADHLDESHVCGRGTGCTRMVVEELNLTTGERTRVYSQVTKGGRWHDVDRVGPDRLVVADIAENRVFVVNTTTEIVEWAWGAQAHYSVNASGGNFKSNDWTHLNDVERLPDGRYMVSLRNHDQVVFLNRTGLQPAWTLGSDDDHATLYEQHNPDFIPPSNGGPAVVVSDSENSRVIEYQYENGTWNRSWSWADGRLQWPRDADRLPNGHTLITDSHGSRVLEVNESGAVVWSFTVRLPYEAERLGTGDESAGGPSASRAGLASRSVDSRVEKESVRSVSTVVYRFVTRLLPSPLLNSIHFITPPWIGVRDFFPLAVVTILPVVWGILEIRWAPYRIEVGDPRNLVTVERTDRNATGGTGGDGNPNDRR